MKKLFAIVLVSIFVLSSVSFAAEGSKMDKKGRAGKALDNIFYGAVEVPDNMDQNAEKPFPKVTAKKNDGFGQGITRIFGGIYQLLTPWKK
jgi:hypothetical protein